MIVFENLAQFLAWLAQIPAQLRAGLLAKSEILAQMLQDRVREKLSGEVLQSVTGRLKDSIVGEVSQDGDTIGGSVSVSGDVPYAAIQEYGGSTKAHIIEALNVKALAFAWNGKQSFYASIHHPGSVIPQRSYMQSSLDEMQDDIVSTMADALEDASS